MHNFPTEQASTAQQISFRGVMTPTLLLVRPGLHSTDVRLFWVCHCHCHCHCFVVFDIRWPTGFTMNKSARPWLKNKHLATCNLYWSPHWVAVSKSKILHEHVNMSGILLTHGSVLAPVQSSFWRVDAFCRPMTVRFVFFRVHSRKFVLEICKPICRPGGHKAVTMRQFRVLYMIFFNNPTSLNFLCQRTHVIRDVNDWECPRIQIWPISTLELSCHKSCPDLHCSPSNALFLSIYFVSTGVTWYFATASCSSNLPYTTKSRKYFNSCFRSWRTSDDGGSFVVIGASDDQRTGHFDFPHDYASRGLWWSICTTVLPRDLDDIWIFWGWNF